MKRYSSQLHAGVMGVVLLVVGLVLVIAAPAATAHAAAMKKDPKVIDTVAVGEGPAGVDVNSVTNRVYVADFRESQVSVIDGATDQVVDTITVPASPAVVAVNDATNRIYVACQSGGIAVIDGTNDTVIKTVTVGSIPDGVAVDRRRNLVYASNFGGGTESVIDGATNRVKTTIQIGGSPFGVTVDPVANRIYVGTYLDTNTVSVINGKTDTLIDTIFQPTIYGSEVSLDRRLHRLYVTGTADDVVVIDTTDDSVVATIAVGVHPTGASVDVATDHVYVPNQFSDSVSIIDATTDAVVHTLAVGATPTYVSANPKTKRVYVTNQDAASVSVIKDTK
jgi:YVTN family beta-propeller protein